MHANFIIDLWPWWIIGLIVSPLLAVLPQLGNIRKAVALGDDDPKAVAGLFLQPASIILTVVFGMATFVFMVLFIAAVLVGIVDAVHGIFT